MKRIKILKNGIVTNLNDDLKMSDAEKDQWLASEIANGSFGKVERWVHEDRVSEDEKKVALEVREVELTFPTPEVIDEETKEVLVPSKTHYKEYRLAAEFEVVEEDISSEIQERERVKFGKACQNFGAELIAWVHSLNEAKVLSVEQFQAILQDPTLASIERCLWNGSIKTAKILVQSMQPGLFSKEEKEAVLAKIDQFLASQGKL